MPLAPQILPQKRFSPAGQITPKNWKKIRAEHTRSQARQLDGIESSEIHKLSIEAKLLPLARDERWFTNFARCGREKFFRLCDNCHTVKQITYQCGQKFCPFCNWKISLRRKEQLEVMTRGMAGVKHIVLTQRNFYESLEQEIRRSRSNLLKLRRQVIGKKISGGCAALELTNEERGWHLHWHMLVTAKFIPADKLSIAWGKLVGQDFAIVKVLDVTEKSYLQEVCKYAAKGSDIAKWTPAQILDFIRSIKKFRLFTVFGKFRELRKWAKAVQAMEREVTPPCPCGCEQFYYGQTEESCERQFSHNYS
jgi:hypothetical protein